MNCIRAGCGVGPQAASRWAMGCLLAKLVNRPKIVLQHTINPKVFQPVKSQRVVRDVKFCMAELIAGIPTVSYSGSTLIQRLCRKFYRIPEQS